MADRFAAANLQAPARVVEWQTRRTQNPLPQGVRVQVPPRALASAGMSGNAVGHLHWPVMTAPAAIERRLAEVGAELRRLREDLRIADEELAHFAAEADDARLRAVVSDDKAAPRAEREAQKSVDAIQRQRHHLVAEVERLERSQDALLDELSDARRTAS